MIHSNPNPQETEMNATPRSTLILTYRMLRLARLEAFPGLLRAPGSFPRLPRFQRMADVAMASAARLAGDPWASIMVSGDEIA